MSKATPMYDPADPSLREAVERRHLAYSLEGELSDLIKRVADFGEHFKIQIADTHNNVRKAVNALESAEGLLAQVAEKSEENARRIPPVPASAVERLLDGGPPPEPPGTYELVMLLNSVEGHHEPQAFDSYAASEALAWLIENHLPSMRRLEELADWCRVNRPRPLSKTRTILIEDLYEAAKQGHYEKLPAENRWRSFVGVVSKDDTSDFGVHFPDFPGCITADSTLDSARTMAKEALEFHISGLLEDGDEIPRTSRAIPPECDTVVAVFFVEVDLDELGRQEEAS